MQITLLLHRQPIFSSTHFPVMKARLGILVVVVCLFSGCVAIPPLINVQHSEPKESRESRDALKTRVEQLERRVSELEAKQERR
jgi:hypothetical protein